MQSPLEGFAASLNHRIGSPQALKGFAKGRRGDPKKKKKYDLQSNSLAYQGFINTYIGFYFEISLAKLLLLKRFEVQGSCVLEEFGDGWFACRAALWNVVISSRWLRRIHA